MRIVVAETAEHYALAASLIREYFHSWGLEDVSTEPELVAELEGLTEYRPLAGATLVAVDSNGEGAGVVALKRVDAATCEMKRMFVRPRWRRRGVGRALASAVMVRAAELGYARMRLDTPGDNLPALAMYRALGFTHIESYLEPDHGHVHDNWSWLAADLPNEPHQRRALRLAQLEDLYLAEDDPRSGCGFTGTEERWEKKRRVVMQAIDKDGTFLDTCCANGYLMESVERWARADGLKIEPHGLDISARLVERARERLPRWAARIHVGDAMTWTPPQRYDFAYVLDGMVPSEHRRTFFTRALDELVAPGGRLIVGLYTLGTAAACIAELRELFTDVYTFQGEELVDSPSRATTIAWIPKH
jgi:GNAT superfamily N-acetyltransferase